MFLSVQISYYPLREDYKSAILKVIERLRESGLEVHSNRMSTQVFGEFDLVIEGLSQVMKWSFETYGKAVFVANFIEGDRRPE